MRRLTMEDARLTMGNAMKPPFRADQVGSLLRPAVLAEARASLDQAKRREIYNEMQIMVSEEAATIIPAYISNVDAITEKLKGLEPNPLGGMMGYAFAEYVWLTT